MKLRIMAKETDEISHETVVFDLTCAKVFIQIIQHLHWILLDDVWREMQSD